MGAQNRNTANFHLNLTSIEESNTFYIVKTVSDRVVRHSLA